MQDLLALILGGGRGARLYPLTKHRSEPAVPIAGKYRLIDIPISNCINSGLQRIYVLTQYHSVSLHRHISNTYKFDPFSRGFVEVLAAQQTNESADWYQGTADAIRQNLRYVQAEGARDVLVLCGDQLYRFDFGRLLQAHRDSGADVTLGVLPVTAGQAGNFGVVRVDEAGRITDLVEKPRANQLADVRTSAEWLQRQGVEARGREHLANMGFYLFRRDALFDLLGGNPRAADVVMELLPGALANRLVRAHLYDGYWEDVGTIRSYFEAHLALASDHPPFDFHDEEGVIYTRMRYLPASRVLASEMAQCLISDGCFVDTGARLQRCVLGVRSRVGRDVVLRDVVLMGANQFEEEQQEVRRREGPPLGIGDGSVLERVIVDKNCHIGRNVQIVNRQKLQNAEGSNYVIRDGIVIIPNGAVVPDGTVI